MSEQDHRDSVGSSELGLPGNEVPQEHESPPRRPYLSDECLRFIQFHAAFEDQRQPGSYARQHIDECTNCQQYFARVAWDRKKEEELLSSPEVEALVAKYAARFRVPFWQRRKFIAAASVLALGALTLGVKAWFGHSSPQPVGTGGSVTPNLDRSFARWDQRLDAAYAQGGVPAISKIFTQGSPNDIGNTVRWIIDRQHTALIPVVVGALTDPRAEVRGLALATLRQLPILAVKPYQSAIASAATAEPNPGLGVAMQKFATEVQNAR